MRSIKKNIEKNKDKDKGVEAEIEEKGWLVDFKAMNMENNKNIALINKSRN